MKRLLSDSLNIKDMFFEAANFQIRSYVESKKDDLGLNEAYSCDFSLEGNIIYISGDEDLQEIEIETIMSIKPTF